MTHCSENNFRVVVTSDNYNVTQTNEHKALTNYFKQSAEFYHYDYLSLLDYRITYKVEKLPLYYWEYTFLDESLYNKFMLKYG